LLRFVFQEPESDITPLEMPALDSTSTGAIAKLGATAPIAVEQTTNSQESPEEVETVQEPNKGV
jgi:hypothetical protein